MENKRVYIQPMKMVFNALLDLMELQKGEEVFNDPAGGVLHYTATMYSFTWTIRFIVLEIELKRCVVRLEVDEAGDYGDGREYLDGFIRREYAILDAMLLIGTPLEMTYGKVGEVT